MDNSTVKILLVEDDQLLREMYLENLKTENYSVDTAVDGEEAYQKMKMGGWDVVLMDIMMPKMNGIEVVKKVRAESSASLTKHLLFLSNMEEESEVREATQLGDGYIIKSSIVPADLLNKIKELLSAN